MSLNCWSSSLFVCFFLALTCIWNCLNRQQQQEVLNDWYGCVNEEGNPTDSFIIYKLPKLSNSTDEYVAKGTSYMYLSSDQFWPFSDATSKIKSFGDINDNWVLSNLSINDQLSMPGRTLKRLYHDPSIKKEAIFILYNDESPDGSKSISRGHTKGVVVITEKGGFWLVHSVPMYPPIQDNTYSYPSTGHKYGQTMLCISVGPSQANDIAWQLVENYPSIYDYNIPPSLSEKFPIFQKAVSGYKPQRHPFFRIAQLSSIGGRLFTSFAKFRIYKKDLYAGLVAPTLKNNLLVETWRNGVGPLPSSCNESYHVINIENLKVDIISEVFSTHHDHSKWAISDNPLKPYVCIGDINRMKSQLHRAGGTVCLSNYDIWRRFNYLIVKADSCPTYI